MRYLLPKIFWAPADDAGGGGAPAGAGAPASAPAAEAAPSAAPGPAPAGNNGAPAGAPAGGPAGGGRDEDPALAAARAFNFDPFSPEDWRAGVNEDGSGQPTEQPPADTGAQAPAGTGAPATQAQTSDMVPLLTRIAQAVEQPQVVPQQVQPGAQARQDPWAWVPQYNVSIPEPWLQAIESDDPAVRRQGLTVLVNGMARMSHARIVTAMKEELVKVLPAVIRHHVSEALSSQQVTSDFYGKYPEFNRDELRPLVVRSAQSIMQETGHTQWSEQLRDAVAMRVRQTLASLFPGAAAAVQQPVPQQAPAQRPPQLTGTGARPSGGEQNDIMRMLW